MNQESLELIFSRRKFFIYLILGYSSFVIPWTLSLLTWDPRIAFVGLFIPWLLFGILLWGLFMTWSRRSEVFLSSETFRISVDRNLFLQLSWNDIEKITLFKEEWEVSATPYAFRNTATGNSLLIKEFESEKTIRLWCFGFGSRKQKMIIAFLKRNCERANIPFSVDNSLLPIIKRQEAPCAAISNFREALKLEKEKELI